MSPSYSVKIIFSKKFIINNLNKQVFRNIVFMVAVLVVGRFEQVLLYMAVYLIFQLTQILTCDVFNE